MKQRLIPAQEARVEIADAMLARAQAGVVVQGVVESRNTERDYSEYERLRAAVHDVLPDGNLYILHQSNHH